MTNIEAKELLQGISADGTHYFLGALSATVARAIKEGEKNIPITDLLQCFENAREFSKKNPDTCINKKDVHFVMDKQEGALKMKAIDGERLILMLEFIITRLEKDIEKGKNDTASTIARGQCAAYQHVIDLVKDGLPE